MSEPSTSGQPEPLPLKDVAMLLVKHYGIKEGLWELALEMQLGVGQVGPAPDAMLPGATFGVSRIGVVKVEKAGPKTVNAAEVNAAADT